LAPTYMGAHRAHPVELEDALALSCRLRGSRGREAAAVAVVRAVYVLGRPRQVALLDPSEVEWIPAILTLSPVVEDALDQSLHRSDLCVGSEHHRQAVRMDRRSRRHGCHRPRELHGGR
jgi:hypothetical protein